MFYDAIEALGLLHGTATASGSLRGDMLLRDGGAVIIIMKIIMKSVCYRAAPARRPRR